MFFVFKLGFPCAFLFFEIFTSFLLALVPSHRIGKCAKGHRTASIPAPSRRAEHSLTSRAGKPVVAVEIGTVKRVRTQASGEI